jgi:hypothetical protein
MMMSMCCVIYLMMMMMVEIYYIYLGISFHHPHVHFDGEESVAVWTVACSDADYYISLTVIFL